MAYDNFAESSSSSRLRGRSSTYQYNIYVAVSFITCILRRRKCMHHSPASVVLRAQCDVLLVTRFGCVCKEAIERFFHSRVDMAREGLGLLF